LDEVIAREAEWKKAAWQPPFGLKRAW